MTEALLRTLLQWFPLLYLLALGCIVLLWSLLVLLVLLNTAQTLVGQAEHGQSQTNAPPAPRRVRRHAQRSLQTGQRRDWQKHLPSYISMN